MCLSVCVVGQKIELFERTRHFLALTDDKTTADVLSSVVEK